EEKKQNINIEVKEDVANGKYCNLAIVNHSASEFVLDFINLMPGAPKAQVQSRIIMTPGHIKRLHAALAENIRKYEENVQRIEEQKQSIPFTMGFKGEA
ncbi:MAG: DUF3467 domain-containing protein, partial [Flavobacteriales bacterium]